MIKSFISPTMSAIMNLFNMVNQNFSRGKDLDIDSIQKFFNPFRNALVEWKNITLLKDPYESNCVVEEFYKLFELAYVKLVPIIEENACLITNKKIRKKFLDYAEVIRDLKSKDEIQEDLIEANLRSIYTDMVDDTITLFELCDEVVKETEYK